MKRFFISFLFFILTLNIQCFAVNDDVVKSASEMAQYNDEIAIKTDNLNQYISDIFDYMPQLEFYYGGYSDYSIGNNHKVSFKYNNTDINYDDIYIADTKESLSYFLTSSILYCKENVYFITDTSYNIENVIEEITEGNQIVSMGYHGYNASSFSSQITNNICYKINFQYYLDSPTLLQYKKQTEDKAIKILCENVAKSMPDYYKEKIIHDYIADNTTYSKEDGDISHTAYNLLINGKGVCEAYADSAKIMFDLLGIENYIVIGTASNSEGTANHSWNIVKLDNGFYNLDITWDDPVGLLAITDYSYFNLTDLEIATDHSWDKSKFPSCSSDEYSYDNVKTLIKKDSNDYDDYYSESDFTSIFEKYIDNTENNSILSSETTSETVSETKVNHIENIINNVLTMPVFIVSCIISLIVILIIILIVMIIK